MPTVNTQLQSIEDEKFLLVERYDRYQDKDHKTQRLHQEDFCQALGIDHYHKYEQDNGPSFVDCFELLQKVSTQPIQDIDNLLRWHIFNFIVGNSDAHAKNLALLYSDKYTVRLTPFYDLVCTRAIEHIDNNLAMSVGGEFRPDHITLKHWYNLAADCGIRQGHIEKLLANIVALINSNLENTTVEFEKTVGFYPAT